ncbi:MAG: hypothetical protein C0483_12895 [Pirellula sp.]|nr:hypothetical protein [Pirellula sp.]
MLIAAFTPEAWTSAGAVAVVTLLLLVRLRNRRRNLNGASAAASRASGSRQAGISATLATRPAERQLVEHYEFAREIEARLDVKRALLEQLLQDADERIARLEALEQSANRAAAAESQA